MESECGELAQSTMFPHVCELRLAVSGFLSVSLRDEEGGVVGLHTRAHGEMRSGFFSFHIICRFSLDSTGLLSIRIDVWVVFLCLRRGHTSV